MVRRRCWLGGRLLRWPANAARLRRRRVVSAMVSTLWRLSHCRKRARFSQDTGRAARICVAKVGSMCAFKVAKGGNLLPSILATWQRMARERGLTKGLRFYFTFNHQANSKPKAHPGTELPSATVRIMATSSSCR